MTNPSAFWGAALVMFIAGIGIPIGAALSAGLGRELSSPVGATAVLYAVGFLIALVALGFAGMPDFGRMSSIPPQYFGGAVFVVFYVLTVTLLAPRIGVGNAVFFVLLGQLVSSAVIDHFGLFYALREPLSLRRGAGIAVMALGVYLAKKTI